MTETRGNEVKFWCDVADGVCMSILQQFTQSCHHLNHEFSLFFKLVESAHNVATNFCLVFYISLHGLSNKFYSSLHARNSFVKRDPSGSLCYVSVNFNYFSKQRVEIMKSFSQRNESISCKGHELICTVIKRNWNRTVNYFLSNIERMQK